MMHPYTRFVAVVLAAALLTGCCCGDSRGYGWVAVDEKPTATAEGREVFVDVSIVRIPAEAIAATLGEEAVGSQDQPRRLSEAEAKSLWSKFQKHEGVRIVQAPKILALDGQLATVSIGETIRFAQTKANGLDFRVEEDPDSPVFIGFVLKMTPTANEAGDRVAMDVHARWREQKQPLGDKLAGMTVNTYLADHVRDWKLESKFEMTNDSSVVLGSRDVREDKDGKHILITLMRAKILKPVGGSQAVIDGTQNG